MRASGTSTAMRSVRRASRSSASASRISHFLRTIASSSALRACVAERSAEALAARPVFQIIQHSVLAVLVFCGKTRAARRAFLRALIEHAAARLRDAVGELAAHLGGERQHPAQHLAQRGDVILRNPVCKLHQLVRKQRRVVEHLWTGLDLDVVRGPGRHARGPLRPSASAR